MSIGNDDLSVGNNSLSVSNDDLSVSNNSLSVSNDSFFINNNCLSCRYDGLNVTYNYESIGHVSFCIPSDSLMNYAIAIAIDSLKDSDPILGQLIDCIGTCQLHQLELEGDLFFELSHSILHQQLSTKVAKVIHARFLQLYPDTQFPSAEDVLNTPDEVLRNVGISRPKIAYLKDLARHAIAGLPTLEELEVMDDESIINSLTRVKGIGRWTARLGASSIATTSW